MRHFALLALGVLILPGAVAAPTSYASSASACDPVLVSPLVRGAPCPIAIRQSGTFTPNGCDGALCTISATASASSQALPGAPRDVTLRLVDALGQVPDAPVCASAAAAGNADATLACSGTAALVVPLAPGACREVRSRAEATQVATFARVVMIQTEVAFRACRGASDELVLTRA